MARLAAFLLLLILTPACAVVRLPLGEPREPREVTLLGEGPDKVLLVDVSGVLSFRRPWGLPGVAREENAPTRLRDELDRARRDPAVKALLVRIDSPGGTVTASDVLFHEIRTFREERGVPVVAAVVEKALSGGYYVALAADEIVAHPTSLVGSVGVFVGKVDASALLERWGVRSELTKSAPQKDLLSPLRPLTPEEQETLRGIVGEFHERFEQTVRAARPQARDEDLATIATAAPFTARRALELHMIDRVGYLQDAFRAALGLAGLPQGRLVAYRRGEAPVANPYSLAALAAGTGAGPFFLDPLWLEEALSAGVQY
ncbi:MAG: signal peptide peptidase SppA [Deferrisomatales bacterium]